MNVRPDIFLTLLAAGILAGDAAKAAAASSLNFKADIQPVLREFCYDCHGDGAKKGGVAFDELNATNDFAEARDVWWKALKNLRAGLMPPAKKPQPTAAQKELVAQWIKTTVFVGDAENPNPGRVTVRR